MVNTSDIQKSFARALLDQPGELPDDLTSYSQPAPVERFNIYRNNVHVGLIDAICAKYPVVLKLVGEEFFRGMARCYIRSNPPASPMIINYGHTFPEFLKTFEHVQDVPYLMDVARLERLRLEAYHAADAISLNVADLVLIDRDGIGELVFLLHPSARVMKSGFAVVSIWEANMADLDMLSGDALSRSEEALIIRPRLDVEILKLPRCGSDFIEALGSGMTLEDANIHALGRDREFDLQLNLSGLIQCGAIIGFSS